ncbi:MAG: flagellar filament capping protein FliD, partial [Spirochaetaceae bacterium]|nr:flagellar filament capping protein FliD [Spirochaetaceae bacterium]
MRSSLQRIMMDPYTTDSGDRMRLLAQVGISTDARRPGSGQGFDASRLRGYLEIDEATLGKALQENFEGVRQLFGNDSDGDLLVDSGAAFALDALIKPYVETGGILSLKTTTLNSQVTSEKRKIEDIDRQLVVKETELKRKYGSMESSLNRMEGVSSSIDAFSKQGNNN